MEISGIILAAGKSSRAGVFKMTSDIYGAPMVERCIEAMYKSCSRIIVVSGYQASLLDYIADKYDKAEVIENTEYELGMYSSVIAGIKAVDGDKIFITPGDCPLICSDIYKSLLCVDSDAVVPACNGVPGHPVLLGRRAANTLLAEKFNSLRDFLECYGYFKLETGDERVRMDIDTPDDFIKAASMMEV